MTVAVVIPTLNEDRALHGHLAEILEQADEVVVSDGGSIDGTCETATRYGATLVTGERGRGPQMNLGAANTDCDVLVFLHADTRLPRGGIDAVREAIGSGHKGGGFLAVFDDDRLILRLGSQLINLRTRVTGLPLGDQAQFTTRQTFRELGGFQDWIILEDLDFIRRLKSSGSTKVIKEPVTTSARRYVQNGILKTIANNWWIWFLFLLGAEPDKLADRYRDTR